MTTAPATATATGKAPSMPATKVPILAVVRVRGHIDQRPDIRDTMLMLRLTRTNHCVVVSGSPSTVGMLQKVKDYVTWGEVTPATLVAVFQKRARLTGDVPLTDKELETRKAGYTSVAHLAEAVARGTVRMTDVKDLKPVIRLHPPLKGWERVKRSFRDRGALGYRGEAINPLLLRMLGPPPEGPRRIHKANPGRPPLTVPVSLGPAPAKKASPAPQPKAPAPAAAAASASAPAPPSSPAADGEKTKKVKKAKPAKEGA